MNRKYLIICASILLAGLPRAFAESAKEPAEIVRAVAPEYPDELHRSGISGVVTIKCTIDIQGNVTSTEVVKSSDKAFDSFAISAVTKWRFKPAQLDGKSIESKVVIPIKFVASEG
jgi:protein TonB